MVSHRTVIASCHPLVTGSTPVGGISFAAPRHKRTPPLYLVLTNCISARLRCSGPRGEHCIGRITTSLASMDICSTSAGAARQPLHSPPLTNSNRGVFRIGLAFLSFRSIIYFPTKHTPVQPQPSNDGPRSNQRFTPTPPATLEREFSLPQWHHILLAAAA